MVKAMVEIYSKYISNIHEIKVVIPRLSRIETNQTLSIVPQNLPKPANIILNELLQCIK